MNTLLVLGGAGVGVFITSICYLLVIYRVSAATGAQNQRVNENNEQNTSLLRERNVIGQFQRVALERLVKLVASTHPAGLDCREVDVILGEVARERAHQLTKGWTREHDRTFHAEGELAEVAAALARPGTDGTALFPWQQEKGSIWQVFAGRGKWTRREQLIVAMAMLVAECERLE